MKDLLKENEAKEIERLFGLDQPPNFEGHAWHLVRRDHSPSEEPPPEALEKMRAARELRVPPATDTKQLTSWNALCIDGLARAGRVLENPDWTDLAAQAMDFVRRHAWQDGQLYAVYAEDSARFPAYLDDHAGLLAACLSLLRARWRGEDLSFAISLADLLLERFMDHERGGFYFTAEGAEAPKSYN